MGGGGASLRRNLLMLWEEGSATYVGVRTVGWGIVGGMTHIIVRLACAVGATRSLCLPVGLVGVGVTELRVFSQSATVCAKSKAVVAAQMHEKLAPLLPTHKHHHSRRRMMMLPSVRPPPSFLLKQEAPITSFIHSAAGATEKERTGGGGDRTEVVSARTGRKTSCSPRAEEEDGGGKTMKGLLKRLTAACLGEAC